MGIFCVIHIGEEVRTHCSLVHVHHLSRVPAIAVPRLPPRHNLSSWPVDHHVWEGHRAIPSPCRRTNHRHQRRGAVEPRSQGLRCLGHAQLESRSHSPVHQAMLDRVGGGESSIPSPSGSHRPRCCRGPHHPGRERSGWGGGGIVEPSPPSTATRCAVHPDAAAASPPLHCHAAMQLAGIPLPPRGRGDASHLSAPTGLLKCIIVSGVVMA